MEAEAVGLFGQFEEGVRQITLFLATGVEAASAIIVGLAVVEAAWRVLRYLSRGPGVRVTHQEAIENIRLRLGHWLAVVLELLLAADILITAVAPTWDDIGKLAAIAAIRTALNYFLDREVREEEQRARARSAPSPLQEVPQSRG